MSTKQILEINQVNEMVYVDKHTILRSPGVFDRFDNLKKVVANYVVFV